MAQRSKFTRIALSQKGNHCFREYNDSSNQDYDEIDEEYIRMNEIKEKLSSSSSKGKNDENYVHPNYVTQEDLNRWREAVNKKVNTYGPVYIIYPEENIQIHRQRKGKYIPCIPGWLRRAFNCFNN